MHRRPRYERWGRQRSIAFAPAFRQLDILVLIFFQAEDGIRDLTVTGVQTCALPISVNQIWCSGLDRSPASFETPASPAPQDEGFFLMPSIMHLMLRSASAQAEARLEARSEERRVGKECRSRWSPYH